LVLENPAETNYIHEISQKIAAVVIAVYYKKVKSIN